MSSGVDDNTTAGPSAGSSSNGATNDAGDFECNICFELAQDPIVTLCGHLFCWPCLYRWLHHHSQSQECPVCKAPIQEEKLVPLYGRGKTTSDPRSRPIPGDEIPNRPSGQRPETAPPPLGPDQNHFSNFGSGFLGGFMPMATARFGNMTMSAGFGGLFPSLLSFQFGFPDTTMYGPAHGFPYGYSHAVHGAHGHGVHHAHGRGFPHHDRPASQGQDSLLKNLLLAVAFLVLVTLVWS